MDTLYEYAQKIVGIPYSWFSVEWNMCPKVNDERDTSLHAEEAWKPSPKITMHDNHTVQCSRGMSRVLGPEFESEGYEELDIPFQKASVMPRRA